MDSEDEEDTIVFASFMAMSAAYLSLKKNYDDKSKRRRIWMISNRDRDRCGSTNAQLFCDLTKEPSGRTDNFCKMSASDFEHLLSIIGPRIAKLDTHFRKCISAKDRLALTLRFLSSGDSYSYLGSLFNCSKQLLSSIIKEVCGTLVNVLGKDIKAPTNSEEWLRIADEWNSKWSFPHCLGAVSGRNITFKTSCIEHVESNSVIALMAVVDANYSILFADASSSEKCDDTYDICNTSFFKKLKDISSKFPVCEPLPGRTLPVPYLFVGNESFPLDSYIMKPYSNTNKNSSSEKEFNSRLSKVNQVSENVLGHMASTFRVLRKPLIQKQEDKVCNIVMACIALHNFLVKSETSSSRYMPPGSVDCESDGKVTNGSWHDDNILTSFLPFQEITKETCSEAIKIRDEISDYFISSITGH